VAGELAERNLVRAWQRGLGDFLRLADGRALSVVYRGRCLGGAGPDVRSALLAFADGQLLEGDVEFHQRASDWFGHHHHDDAHYRSVVLHVVMVDDAPSPRGPDGHPLPTLVVAPAHLAELAAIEDTAGAGACHRLARQLAPVALGTLLDGLGDRRLAQRAARFEADLTRLSSGQLAQEALFDALGFSKNRSPFVRLAQSVPSERIGALIGRRPPEEALVLVQAILFGAAGLLPSQRPNLAVDWEGDDIAEELEAIWALYRQDWEGQLLTADDWTFGGVRPANYPTRRIATAAHLLVRYRGVGLDRGLVDPLRARAAAPDGSDQECLSPTTSELERLFLVDDPDGYWASHSDFGRPLPGGVAALLGRDRARDALVNVALPLALAQAAQTDDRALADAAWAVYRSFPRPSPYQATQRLAADLGLSDRLVTTARRQQGLLHLVRNHCEGAGCLECPLLSPSPG
jgi:hypothetical protein